MNWLAFVPTLLVVPVPPHARPVTPVTTFSIVARDSVTGEMGVAVQSHYFSVGPIVPWAEAGVGVVATQSLVRVEYGPDGLDLMRAGRTANEALDSLLAADPNPGVRQVAMVDAHGNVAVHTGGACIPDAGHRRGGQYSVQANLMANHRVWPAMAAAFENAEGDLTERLLQALEAAQEAGGDIRGRQSAAILVVSATSTGKPWVDRIVDLRVEDHPEPIAELRRLVRLRRAYRLEDQGDELIAAGEPAKALEAYAEAAKLAPDVVELQFWAAVSTFTTGREHEGLRAFHDVFAREPHWAQLIPRLAKVGLFPDDPDKIRAVLKQAP